MRPKRGWDPCSLQPTLKKVALVRVMLLYYFHVARCKYDRYLLACLWRRQRRRNSWPPSWIQKLATHLEPTRTGHPAWRVRRSPSPEGSKLYLQMSRPRRKEVSETKLYAVQNTRNRAKRLKTDGSRLSWYSFGVKKEWWKILKRKILKQKILKRNEC